MHGCLVDVVEQFALTAEKSPPAASCTKIVRRLRARRDARSQRHRRARRCQGRRRASRDRRHDVVLGGHRHVAAAPPVPPPPPSRPSTDLQASAFRYHGNRQQGAKLQREIQTTSCLLPSENINFARNVGGCRQDRAAFKKFEILFQRRSGSAAENAQQGCAGRACWRRPNSSARFHPCRTATSPACSSRSRLEGAVLGASVPGDVPNPCRRSCSSETAPHARGCPFTSKP